MNKINIADLPESSWDSPTGKFGGYDRQLTQGLGKDSRSPDLTRRPPFDVEITRVPAGKAVCPYHVHTNQWEHYIVLSGRGTVRDEQGTTEAGPGDTFIFGPGEAHQMTNTGTEDWVFYVIADNPLTDFAYYPDSKKWSVLYEGKRAFVKGEIVPYHEGEDPVGQAAGA